MQRMTVASKYARISNLEFKKAAEILTATVNSMGIDIERASDVFSYLGDATATGADEIGRAFQRVGGTAGALKLPFEKVASYVAVISSRTRESAETIGNAVKSIFARIQSVRERGFAEEDGTSINQVARALQSADIDLMDKQGQFRDFTQVLDELGAKWNSLDTITKAYLATTVAGTYQQSRFLTLMDGYKETIPLYEKALQAAGTTTQKFTIYQQGTQAAIDKLKATMEGLWQGLFDSQMIRAAVGFLANSIESVNTTISSIGGFTATFGAVAIASTLLSSRIKLLGLAVIDKTIAVTRNTAALMNNANTLTLVAARQQLVANTTARLNTALRNTGTALLSVGRSFAGIAVAASIAMGIGYLIQKLFEWNTANAEQQKAIENSIEQYKLNRGEIEKNVERYEELSKVANKTKEEQEEYINIQNKLHKTIANVTEKIDEQGDAHLKNASAVRSEYESIKQLADQKILAEKNSKLTDLGKELSSTEGLKQREEILNRTATYSKEYNESLLNSKKELSKADKEFLLNQLTVSNFIKKENENVKRFNEEFASSLNNVITSTFDKIANSTDESAEKIIKLRKELGYFAQSFTAEELLNIDSSIPNVEKKLIDLVIASGRSADSWNSNKDALISLGVSLDAYNKMLTLATGTTTRLGNVSQSFNLNLNKITDLSIAAREELAELNRVITTVSENKPIDRQTVDDLLKIYPELKKSIEITNDGYTVQLDILKKLREQKLNQHLFIIQTELGLTEMMLSELEKRASMYDIEIKAITDVASAKKEILKIDQEIARQSAINTRNQMARGQSDDRDYNFEIVSAEILQDRKSISILGQARELFNKLKPTLSSPTLGLTDKDKKDSNKKGLDISSTIKTNIERVIDGFNSQFKQQEIKNQVLEDKIKNNLKSEKDYQNAIIKTNQLITGQVKTIELIGNANEKIANKRNDLINRAISSKLIDRATLNSFFNVDGTISDNLTKYEFNVNEQAKKVQTNEKLAKQYLEQKDNVLKLVSEIEKLNRSQTENKNLIPQLNNAIDSNKSKIIEYREAYEKLYSDRNEKFVKRLDTLVNSVVGSYKKAYKSLTDTEEKRHKTRMSNLDAEMDKFEEYTNKLIDNIDRQAESEDYRLEIEKKQKERLDLVNQKTIVSQDRSIEGILQAAELQKEIDQIDEELSKSRIDRERQLNKQTLQDLANAKRKQIEITKDTEQKRHDVIMETLESQLDEEKITAQIRESIYQGHSNQLKSIFEDLTSSIKQQSELLGSSLTKNVINKIKEASNSVVSMTDKTELKKTDKLISNDPTLLQSNLSQVYDSLSLEERLRKAKTDTIFAEYMIRQLQQSYARDKAKGETERLSYYHDLANQVRKSNPLIKFDTGGATGNREGLAFLHKKEYVLNPKNFENILNAVKIADKAILNMTKPTTQKPTENKTIQVDNLIKIDKIEKGSDLNIKDLVRNAVDELQRQFRTYGFNM